MTTKRFFIGIDKKNGVGLFDGDLRLMYIQFSNIEDAKSCEDALIYQCNLMNELHEENQLIKKNIRELYKIVKIDVDNEIEVYPKVLFKHLCNILKIIGDLE